MQRTTRLFLSILLVVALAGTVHARIINVPDDQETIQAGINASDRGDTVLVQPGVYTENINISGRQLTLASLFLMTGDEAYIDSTIIDGNREDHVVTAIGTVDSTSVLTGFTIRYGYAEGNYPDSHGGGIILQDACPSLSHLIITDNEARSAGGGISCISCSSVNINNVTITRNHANSGGGLYMIHSMVNLTDVFIVDNEATGVGGGIYCYETPSRLYYHSGVVRGNRASEGGGFYFVCGSRGFVYEVAICENEAVRGGGFYVSGWSEIYLQNTLVVGNNAEEAGGGFLLTGSREKNLVNVTIIDNIAETGSSIQGEYHSPNTLINCVVMSCGLENIKGIENCTFNIAYCDIIGGEENIVLENRAEVTWGEGNIDEDPLFIDADRGDYHLTEDSPCIDTGDPDQPADPDGTRSDMGAFPYLIKSVIYGLVLDAADDEPLPSALITSSEGHFLHTDSLGYYQIPMFAGDYTFTASYPSYLDLSIERHIDLQDTVEVVFRLLHSEFNLRTEEITQALDQGESTRISFDIRNNGNGSLSWSQTIRMLDNEQVDPWTLRQSLNVSDELDSYQIKGCAFIDDRFYVTGRSNDTCYVYILDRDGNYIDRFPQFGESLYGMRDLAWDGELIWGSGERTVFGFRSNGELVERHEGPLNPIQSIAWDSDRNMFWASAITSNIFGCDRNFQTIREIPRNNLRIYGLAYWSEDPDGYQLYAFHRDPETDHQEVYKINLENGEMMFVACLNPEGEEAPSGAFITDRFDPFRNWVFMGVSNTSIQQGGDRIDVWQLQPNNFWIDVYPESSVLQPNSNQIMTVDFLTYDAGSEVLLDEGDYHAEIFFTHNAEGGEFILSVCLTVTDPNFTEDDTANLPDDFSIVSVHPNPFNAATSIRYSLPQATNVKLSLIDYTGRTVLTITQGRQLAGNHAIGIDGSTLPTGVYVALLESGNAVRYTKLVCVK